jgi:hypothetical protein
MLPRQAQDKHGKFKREYRLCFGSGLDMESKSELYIHEVAESVAYAHSKNISIGG